MATSLSAKPQQWPDFFTRLTQADPEHPTATILAAIALGWSEKWR